MFAGGGGASTGIEQAIGQPVDAAINHDADAIGMHEVNHPQTKHYRADIREMDPLSVTKGELVGLLHASPDCTHHSQALGGQPRLRTKPGTDEPFVTDNGGHLLDVAGLSIDDPVALETEINGIVGVIAVGLFAAALQPADAAVQAPREASVLPQQRAEARPPAADAAWQPVQLPDDASISRAATPATPSRTP